MYFFSSIRSFADSKYKLIIVLFFIIFFIIGILSVSDYGISTDEGVQRDLGNNALNLVLKNDKAIFEYENKYHGTGFTLPLTILVKSLNIKNLRTIFLIRHYFTFLLFYISVIFFYLLCRKYF